MIKVTRINGEEYYVNPHLIEFMEKPHNTVITMLSDKKVLVKEDIEEIISKIIDYRKKLGNWGNDPAY